MKILSFLNKAISVSFTLKSIFNPRFYKDLQIEGIFDVLSRVVTNLGGRSPVTLISLCFKNSGKISLYQDNF